MSGQFSIPSRARPVEFSLDLPAPLDLPASLATLGRWGDDAIDRWNGRRLLRVARLPRGAAVAYRALVSGDLQRPRLEVTAQPFAGDAGQLERSIYLTFAGAPSALLELAERDALLGALAVRYPGLVPVLVPDPFSALIRSISAQQVNLRWAAEIRRRLANRYGRPHELEGETVYSLDAVELALASENELRDLQLTRAKARSVVACARAAVEGGLERTELEKLEDEELISYLTRLPGIGRWSAEWFLARTLGRPRVVAGDLGVRKAIGRLYANSGLAAEDEVRGLTAHWGPAAAVAQTLALHDLAERPVLVA